MAIFRRFANLFRRTSIDREIAAELEAHIELATEQGMRRGLPHDVARRDALIRFGNRTSTRERVAAADTTLGLEGIGRDIRFALRQLAHSPGFAITAIITLAVAIGANAIVFSVLNALVLRPINLPGARQLYTIQQHGLPMNSYPDYRDVRDRNRTFSGVALYNFAPVGLNTDGNPKQSWVYEASGNYFDVLGVQPYLGRFFHATDEHGPDSSPYIVLSYSFWQNRFHSDAGVVGRPVELNRHVYTILGVAPPQFRGAELIYSPDLWVPMVDEAQIEGTSDLEDRNNRGLWMIGRLKPQVTVAQSEGDLARIAADLKKAYPIDDDGLHFTLARPGLVGDMLGGPVRAFVAGLMLLAGLILLAACANLGSLFAARAADRGREIALRLALGSTRRRIVRQLMTEALLISLIGGAIGIAGSVALLRAMSAWQPLPQFPISVAVNPDAMTYVVAVALALLSGLLCGLAPVRQVFGASPWELVKTGVKSTSKRSWFSAQGALLVVQIAVCAVLMTSSLVAVRGLARSLHSSFGFDPTNALVVSSDLNMAGYSGERIPAMQRRMIDASAALPGVTGAGLIDNIPLGLGWSETSIFKIGATDFRESSEASESMAYGISPGYFQAAGTVLLAGRDLNWHDTDKTTPVAVVNRTLAMKVFGSIDRAVGAQFIQGSAHTHFLVVGVVEDGKYISLAEDEKAAYFRPLLQSPSNSSWLVVRSSGDAQRIAEPLRETLRGLDEALPLSIMTWNSELTGALFAPRAATVSLGVLGMLGALLAATGIFGLASYSVGKRLREMGIRIALGAGNGQVLRAAVGRSFRLLAIGSLAGMVLGMAATKLLSYIVYQASPRDPVVLAGTVAAMLTLGLIATWAPAQRALRVDPSRLMREE
ncbi:MAG TPA: ABC transporter permease [Terracidiphilus sp.]|jgi:macrolide transport system ATP-binding/permease protein|nr:ABC transporter permease [Terracidiphilus sp.]